MNQRQIFFSMVMSIVIGFSIIALMFNAIGKEKQIVDFSRRCTESGGYTVKLIGETNKYVCTELDLIKLKD